MFLSEAEREALLRIGDVAAHDGRFDANKAFQLHQLPVLSSLRRKRLVHHEQGAYSITPAGLRELEALQQEKHLEENRADEIRKEKQYEWVREIVLLLLGAIITMIAALITE